MDAAPSPSPASQLPPFAPVPLPGPSETTSALPMPPPVDAGEDEGVRRLPRPGELTSGWATAFWTTWLGVAGAWAAVWVSSRTTGLSTWWLGPESEPRWIGLSLAPFVAPLALAGAAFARVRWLPWAGMVAALAHGAIGVGDLGRVDRYALVELAVASGAFAVSAASLSGLLRKPFG